MIQSCGGITSLTGLDLLQAVGGNFLVEGNDQLTLVTFDICASSCASTCAASLGPSWGLKASLDPTRLRVPGGQGDCMHLPRAWTFARHARACKNKQKTEQNTFETYMVILRFKLQPKVATCRCILLKKLLLK